MVINATPNSDYQFIDWTGSATVSTATYAFTVTGNMNFTANFVKATLTAANSTITIMDGYNLSVNISNNNYSISSVEYYIGNDKLSSCNGTTCNEFSKKPGRWNIHAKVTLSNGIMLTTNIVQVEVQFPNISTIKANGTIQSYMDAAWAQTKNAASSASRQEFGFWIYVNTNTMTFECDDPPKPGDTVTGCAGTHASVMPGSPNEQHGSPVQGGKYAVAHFHTHTPLTFCPSDASRTPVGNSSADQTVLSQSPYEVPGLVYDYVGGYVEGVVGNAIQGGHNISASAKVYTFSVNRRPTPPYTN